MRASVLLLVIAGLAGPARAETPDDPFAVLRDPARRWVFQPMRGDALDKLAPSNHMPWLLCKAVAWEPPKPDRGDKLVGSQLSCEPAPAPGSSGFVPVSAPVTMLWLVYEAGGVRQVEGDYPATLHDKARSRSFTFPAQLAKPWTFDERGTEGARVTIGVRAQPMTVLGVSRPVWVADAKRWTNPSDPPAHELAVFAPGIGPALLCSIRPTAPMYQCLQLAEDKAPKPVKPPPPPPPQPQVSIATRVAHDKSSLKIDTVAAKVLANAGAVRACYQRVLAKQPTLRGVVSLDFTVNAVGKTTAIAARGVNDDVAACIAKLAAGWTFAIPQSEYSEPRTARFSLGIKLAPGA